MLTLSRLITRSGGGAADCLSLCSSHTASAVVDSLESAVGTVVLVVVVVVLVASALPGRGGGGLNFLFGSSCSPFLLLRERSFLVLSMSAESILLILMLDSSFPAGSLLAFRVDFDRLSFSGEGTLGAAFSRSEDWSVKVVTEEIFCGLLFLLAGYLVAACTS